VSCTPWPSCPLCRRRRNVFSHQNPQSHSCSCYIRLLRTDVTRCNDALKLLRRYVRVLLMEHGGEGFGVSSMLYWFFSAVVHPRHNICDVFIYQAGADVVRGSLSSASMGQRPVMNIPTPPAHVAAKSLTVGVNAAGTIMVRYDQIMGAAPVCGRRCCPEQQSSLNSSEPQKTRWGR
jgi:hypothetical protein